MSEVLWKEVHDIVQETGIKIIPKKKKCKKAKQLSEEALQTAVKRREVKSKGEKERYTHLNAEFQRIARRDKKAFLRDQRNLPPAQYSVVEICKHSATEYTLFLTVRKMDRFTLI